MREITDLAKTEADRLIGLRNWALLLTLSTSGLRVELLRTLTREQLIYRPDLQRHVLSVRSKNETAPRDVPLSPEAYAAILLKRFLSSDFFWINLQYPAERWFLLE